MRYSEQFIERVEYSFAAFCKVVFRNAAISVYRDFVRKQKHEVSLDYLMSELRKEWLKSKDEEQEADTL